MMTIVINGKAKTFDYPEPRFATVENLCEWAGLDSICVTEVSWSKKVDQKREYGKVLKSEYIQIEDGMLFHI